MAMRKWNPLKGWEEVPDGTEGAQPLLTPPPETVQQGTVAAATGGVVSILPCPEASPCPECPDMTTLSEWQLAEALAKLFKAWGKKDTGRVLSGLILWNQQRPAPEA